MSDVREGSQGALRLAERLIQLLDQSSFSATYKYAVLIALMDLCLERTSQTGLPPETLTTRQLAEKVIALYWPHSQTFDTSGVLRQSTGGPTGQAEILRRIIQFRQAAQLDPAASLPLSRAQNNLPPERWESLVHFVEWKLIEMPLPRLQFIGTHEDRFLYQLGWRLEARKGGLGVTVRRQDITRYQLGDGTAFDNRILLMPGVGEQLIQLSGVLRSLIHRQWAAKVARMNNLEEARLEQFLFGARRIDLSPVRAGLRELQDNRCFYCDSAIHARSDVDHFIPWSRHQDNAIDNLVIAHSSCNNQKRDFLAAAEHVERWRKRSIQQGSALRAIAADAAWESQPDRAFSVGRAIYAQLPEDARLWYRGEEFVPHERQRVLAVFEVSRLSP